MCRPRMCQCLLAAVLCAAWCSVTGAQAQPDPLPSWNDGPTKQAVVEVIRATTDPAGPELSVDGETHRHFRPGRHAVGREADGSRNCDIAWIACGWWQRRGRNSQNVEPFKTVLSGDREAMAKLSMKDLEKILVGHAHRHVGGRSSAPK